MEFLRTGAPEKSKSPQNLQNSGFFWASPFTMYLVCTLLIFSFWGGGFFPNEMSAQKLETPLVYLLSNLDGDSGALAIGF